MDKNNLDTWENQILEQEENQIEAEDVDVAESEAEAEDVEAAEPEAEAQRKYEELSKSISASVEEIQVVTGKIDHLAEYKEKVIDHVQSLSAISQQNTASNEEVSNHVEQMLEEIKEVTSHCEKMNAMAEELNQSVEYFYEEKEM